MLSAIASLTRGDARSLMRWDHNPFDCASDGPTELWRKAEFDAIWGGVVLS